MARHTAVLASSLAFTATCTDSPHTRTQGIVSGTETQGYEIVAATVEDGLESCTATLIAPRVVATAAHCVEGSGRGTLRVYFGPGQSLDPGTVLDTIHGRKHPAYEPGPQSFDVGVLQLGSPSDLTPATLATAAPAVDDRVTIVGFGRTSAADEEPRLKRIGTSRVSDVTTNQFRMEPDPSQPCDGDSGAPVFADDATAAMLGIIAGGDPDCATFSLAARVDAVRDFLIDYVNEVAESSATLGERCWYEENCVSGDCVFDPASEGLGYCSGSCVDDSDCVSGLHCDDGRCLRDSPAGSNGEPCTWDDDCLSQSCARPTAQASFVCAAACAPGEGLTCESGFTCMPDADSDEHLCFENGDSGCSSSRTGRPPALALALLLLGALRAHRRRKRSSGT